MIFLKIYLDKNKLHLSISFNGHLKIKEKQTKIKNLNQEL